MLQAHHSSRDFLITDSRLADMFAMFDDLHDAASEGELQDVTGLDNRELVGWLQELVFTAQETITEIEKRSALCARQEPMMRLVK